MMMISATFSRRVRPVISSRICAWIVTSRAVVGSSAMISRGSQVSAMAIMIRCRMPPESWCGYWPKRRLGSAIPTRARSSMARRSAVARSAPRCCCSVSVSWRPMVSTGLSDVIGSWNTMPISLPRTARISSGDRPSRSRPPNRIWPSVMRPGGSGMRRRIDMAPTDLPDPLSPTMATVSPGSTV